MATPGYARTPYSPTRFPAGITNANVGQVTANLGKPDETKFYTDFEDFFVYTAADWSVAGAPTAALVAGGVGGVLSLTGTAATSSLRRSVASFLMTAGKQTFVKFRVASNDMTAVSFWFGLVNAGADDTTATDGMFISKAAGDLDFSASVRKDATTGANTVTDLGSFTNDTYTVLGLHYDGKQTVEVFQDDAKLASLDASSTYFPDAALQLAFGMGVIGEMIFVDYIYATNER